MEKKITFYSSFVFLFPIFFATKYKQSTLALILTFLLITSLCNHGQYYLPFSWYVDTILAHIVTVTLTLYGTYMVIKGHKKYLIPSAIGYFIMLSYKGLHLTQILHAIILHFFGAIALTLFIFCDPKLP
jgi:hypothetical protein